MAKKIGNPLQCHLQSNNHRIFLKTAYFANLFEIEQTPPFLPYKYWAKERGMSNEYWQEMGENEWKTEKGQFQKPSSESSAKTLLCPGTFSGLKVDSKHRWKMNFFALLAGGVPGMSSSSPSFSSPFKSGRESSRMERSRWDVLPLVVLARARPRGEGGGMGLLARLRWLLVWREELLWADDMLAVMREHNVSDP